MTSRQNFALLSLVKLGRDEQNIRVGLSCQTFDPTSIHFWRGRGAWNFGKLEVTGQVAKTIAQQQNISLPTTSDGLDTTLMVGLHRMGYYTMDSLYLTYFCQILTDFTNFCTALTEVTEK